MNKEIKNGEKSITKIGRKQYKTMFEREKHHRIALLKLKVYIQSAWKILQHIK